MKIALINIMKCVLRIIYAPMKLFRSKNKIVYLSRQSDEMSLDMALLSQEISRISPDTIQVFRLKVLKKGFKGILEYALSMLVDMYHLATARVAVCDTYSISVSCLNHKKELQIVQIWHALGAIKKFGLQSMGREEGRDEQIARAMQMHEHYTYVTTPSDATAEFYKEAFGVNEGQVVWLTLPRVDYLSDGKNKKVQLIQDNPRLAGKKIVLYLPTFRGNEEAIVNRIKQIFDVDEEYALIISLHPHSCVKDKERYGVKGSYHSFDLIKSADYIITDYSACAFEALVADKPLYFYVPDYDEYEQNRGLNINLMSEMAPYVFKDAGRLRQSLKQNVYGFEMAKQFREKYIPHAEYCTETMATFIVELVNKEE